MYEHRPLAALAINMKSLLTISILLLSLSQIYGAVQVDFCYVINERSGDLIRVAQDGSQFATIGQIAETSVEAIAWDRIGELWMFDADSGANGAFYTLDLATGLSTYKHPAPTAIRSDVGTVHQIKDVDSMDFDAFDSNILWCVERIQGGVDLLFSLDVTTGQVIGNTAYPVTGVGLDIDDLAIDPLTGTTYAISNTNGMGDQLIVLDTLSGAGFVIGNLLEGGVQIIDMEGFGFDVDGQLIGTTGRDGDPFSNALYFINKATGAVEFLTVIDPSPCADIESIACFSSRIELRALSKRSLLKSNDDPDPCAEFTLLFASGDLSFDDPCSCEDPLNCTVGGVIYFHDILTVRSADPLLPLGSGEIIEILGGATDFYTGAPCPGMVVPAGTLIPESSTAGVYEINFWRPGGVVPSLMVSINGGAAIEVPAATFEPVCITTCPPTSIPIPIPTMGQWGLICLGLLLLIFGVVAVKERKIALGK